MKACKPWPRPFIKIHTILNWLQASIDVKKCIYLYTHYHLRILKRCILPIIVLQYSMCFKIVLHKEHRFTEIFQPFLSQFLYPIWIFNHPRKKEKEKKRAKRQALKDAGVVGMSFLHFFLLSKFHFLSFPGIVLRRDWFLNLKILKRNFEKKIYATHML